MQKITTFLWFDHQAEAAAKFYVSVFKARSKIDSITRYPKGSPGNATGVMTVEFTLNGQQFVALNGGPHFKFTEAISLVVNCKNQKEIDSYWKKLLSGGGQESMCGWLKDRYGVSWQVVPADHGKLFSGKNPARAQRAMEAMLGMRKLDIKKLKAAADGKD